MSETHILIWSYGITFYLAEFTARGFPLWTDNVDLALTGTHEQVDNYLRICEIHNTKGRIYSNEDMNEHLSGLDE